jgi:short-subunit dehydrogenase
VGDRMTRLDKDRFGPWAVVTGSSSGIGREFARQVAASGINVVLVARRRRLLEELARELADAHGVQTRVVSVDLTAPDFMAPILEATEGLDIGLLISNAGEPLPGAFLDLPLERLERQARLDVSAPLRLVHHFGRQIAGRGRGGVLLVSAMGAGRGLPFVSASAAGRSFILSLGESLHVELAKRGVNATVLVTGPTNTRVIGMMGLDPERMPIKPQSPASTAAEALGALAANRPTHLSGRANRLFYRLVPASVSTRMARGLVEQGLRNLAAQGDDVEP